HGKCHPAASGRYARSNAPAIRGGRGVLTARRDANNGGVLIHVDPPPGPAYGGNVVVDGVNDVVDRVDVVLDLISAPRARG
ncbi:hypothetical protein C6A85_08395, partial [Mycobacterium sp. ITM-2017-0098]